MAEQTQSEYEASRLEEVTGKTDDMSRAVSAKGREIAQQAKENTEELVGSVARTVKEHPLETLVIITGLAFAIAALWKIRGTRDRHSRVEALFAHLPDISRRNNIWTIRLR
jgi:hypothetical protein